MTMTEGVGVLRADFFDEGEAVHAGEFEVREDEVDIGGEFEAVLGGPGGFDIEVRGGEMKADDSTVFFFVLNNEDGGTGHLFYCAPKRRAGRRWTRMNLAWPAATLKKKMGGDDG